MDGVQGYGLQGGDLKQLEALREAANKGLPEPGRLTHD